jgi:VanZ family protein
MTALFALSSVPQPASLDEHQVLMVQPTWQTLLHIPAYFVLALLWWRTLRTRKWPIGAAAGTAIILAAIYGVLDEVHQYFVPGRFLSLTDLGMNLIGAVLGGAWALLRDRGFVPARPTY